MTTRAVSRFHLVAAAAALMAAFSREASAYIDPASGSFILQMLIAGLVGAAFAVKIFWRGIKTFVVGIFSRKDKTDDSDG